MINDTLVSVTSQGQITIPVSIRRLLGITKESSVVIGIEQDRIILEKPKDIFSRLGVHKDKALKGKTFDQILELESKAFEEGIKEKHTKLSKNNGK
jgi:AbrB family looped-hinge helix DNA binding protein